ncbi:MAG: hypothetical protein JXR96_22945 [Deltaproteobacteria bacterium]|nr:hypothetical protein [Deltaproteobacteria bacterium]
MRIAGGILLIISFLINLVMGGCATMAGAGGSAVQDAAAKEGVNLSTTGLADKVKEEAKKAGGEITMNEDAKKAFEALESIASPTMYLVFGILMIVSAILQLIGAIFLFTNKQKMMILIFMIVGIGVAVWGMFGGFLGFGWVSYPTLIACILGLIASFGVGGAAPAAPPAEAPPAEG